MKIIAIGKISKNSDINKLIEDYTKRMKNKLKIVEIETNNKYQNIESILNHEEEKILQYFDNSSFNVILDIAGRQLSSEELAHNIEKWKQIGSEIRFFIGGSYGFSEKVKKSANYSLSFGKITLPHMLARLILIEQLYRSESIINNHPYHK